MLWAHKACNKLCSQAFVSFSCLPVNMLHITVDNWTRPGIPSWPAPCTAAKSLLYSLICPLFRCQGLKRPCTLLSLTTPMYHPWILRSYPVGATCIPHFVIVQGIFLNALESLCHAIEILLSGQVSSPLFATPPISVICRLCWRWL